MTILKLIAISLSLVFASTGVVTAHAAAGQVSVCSLVNRAAIQSIVVLKLEQVDALKGAISEDCVYMTVPGEGGPGFFVVRRLTIAIPKPQGIVAIITSAGDKNEFAPVSGLGDEAIINNFTHEVSVRSGTSWYHVLAGGMPCPGDVIGAKQDVKDKCKAIRNDAAIQAAMLILKGV